MAQNLQALGEASYNGWTFSPRAETIGFKATFHQDQAKRTIVWTTYVITIKDKIPAILEQTGITGVDTLVQQARQKLGVQGGTFKYVNRGMGNTNIAMPGIFRVNTGSPNDYKDLVW